MIAREYHYCVFVTWISDINVVFIIWHKKNNIILHFFMFSSGLSTLSLSLYLLCMLKGMHAWALSLTHIQKHTQKKKNKRTNNSSWKFPLNSMTNLREQKKCLHIWDTYKKESRARFPNSGGILPLKLQPTRTLGEKRNLKHISSKSWSSWPTQIYVSSNSRSSSQKF